MAENLIAATENAPALPDKIAGAIQGVVSPFIPTTIKVVVRLINSAVEYPVALIEREVARVKSQTRSIQAVEAAVGEAVANRVVTDDATLDRAAASILHRSYREQLNREGVAAAFVEEMSRVDGEKTPHEPLMPDEDWMGPYEQYAGFANSDRVRQLWGKILAGQVRNPGSFSINSLRVLSEISQKQAESLQKVARYVVSDVIPVSSIDKSDLSDLIELEEAGLLIGTTMAFTKTYTMSEAGNAGVREKDYTLLVQGASGVVRMEVYKLTSAGREVLTLVEGRDQVSALKGVSGLFKDAMPNSAGTIFENDGWSLLEVLWDESLPVDQ